MFLLLHAMNKEVCSAKPERDNGILLLSGVLLGWQGQAVVSHAFLLNSGLSKNFFQKYIKYKIRG